MLPDLNDKNMNVETMAEEALKDGKILSELLSIDQTHHDPERKDLIKSGAIESFTEYFGESKDHKKILEFVKKQQECKSPRKRKLARKFLAKWG